MKSELRFKSIFDDVIPAPDPVYPRTAERFSEIVLPDGTIQRKKIEDFPFYDSIQSYEASSNISALLRRARAGDVSAINKRQGLYLDLSGMPNDPFEAAEYFRTLSEQLLKNSENGKKSDDQSVDQSCAAEAVSSENGKNSDKEGE